MQWMLFQEKFTSIDRAFSEVKERNQEMSNSLRDILNVLESVERVNVTSDKLASEVRSRIFGEIDKWSVDRQRQEKLLSDISLHITDLAMMLESHLDSNDIERNMVVKEIKALTTKMRDVETIMTSNNEGIEILRQTDCRDPETGKKHGILSREWFIWHWKRGFGALVTTIILALFLALFIPLIIHFGPKIELQKVFVK